MLDRAPVRRYAQRAADPARLWVQGRLFGLDPVPLESCRVLELGCGDGAHLAGIAARHPEMRLLGLDERADAIAEGQRLVERSGLKNLSLEVGGLPAPDSLDEPFDYVMCLGSFSRLEAGEQHRLLATLARLLTPRGLACIEYDVHPGFRWHELVADLLKGLVARSDSELTAPSVRRELTRLLESRSSGPELSSLRPELETWARRDDAWLVAELAAPRRGLLFHAFCLQLEPHGLRYVCEASDIEGAAPFRDRARELLESRTHPLEREQYVDFLTGRRFRRSLLARAEAEPAATARPEICRELYCVSPLAVGAGNRFIAPSGLEVHIADHVMAAVVTAAAAVWPEALGHTELSARVRAQLSTVEPAAVDRALLVAHRRDWVELRRSRTGRAARAGARPRVAPLNRAEMELGRPMTNGLHVPIGLGQGPAARLVSWLDGTRDRAELERLLLDNGLVPDQRRSADTVGQVLAALATRALLESESVS